MSAFINYPVANVEVLSQVNKVGQYLPSGKSSLVLDFAGMAALDPRITFTRGTNATYTNSAGNVQLTAGVNNARFDYDPVTLACKGLLIEEARTNSLTYSEQFDNAAWLKLGTATVTANTTISPDGTLTADTLTLPASADRINLAAVSVAGSTAYILSAWLSGSGTVYLSMATSGGTYKFVGSPITLTSTLTRYTQTITTNSDNTGLFPIIGRYDGNAGAGTATSCVIWGAQLEAGAFPTSYIPTTTAAATRNADVASMTGTNFSSWYNQTQGTFVVNCLVAPVNAVLIRASIAADGASNTNNIYIDTSSGSVRLVVFSASSATVVLYPVPVPSIGSVMKISTAYAANNFAASINGNSVSATASGALPIGTMDILGIGNVGTLSQWNTTIASISYYPTRLPNATLQALTV